MRDLVGPHGELLDFVSRPGDPPYSRAIGSKASRWGSRLLLSNDPAVAGASTRATFVATGDLGRSYPIALQMRFAARDPASGQPILPFTAIPPGTLPSVALAVNVRRGTDPLAPVTTDQFTISVNPPVGVVAFRDSLPVDIIVARDLGVEISIGASAAPASVFVEFIAAEVENVSRQNEVPGWGFADRRFIAAVATPGNATLLIIQRIRAQFIIVNTSTNADLILDFGNTASWVGPAGTIVLPKNTFATYESPVGGYNGPVTGSWNNGAPDGGAIVTSGSWQ